MILQHLKKWFLRFLLRIDRFIARILIWLIIYSRPLFGPSKVCPIVPGCTEFAIEQLQKHWFGYAITQIGIRLLWCNPIGLFFKFHFSK